MSQQHRVADVRTFDGTRLHAERRDPARPRAGAPALVCCNGVGVSTFFWHYLESYFTERGHPVITWDYRGHNRSDPSAAAENHTIEACARDLLHVMDALDVGEPAVLVGHSMGVQVILEAAGQFPARVAALVPMLGTYGRPLDSFFHSPRIARGLFSVFHWLATTRTEQLGRLNEKLSGASWAGTAARLFGLVDPELMADRDLQNYLEHMATMDPAVFFSFAQSLTEHTAEPYLDRIEAPTLVVAGERDLFTPLHCSEHLAHTLPKGELFVVEKGSHACLVEQPDLVNGRVHDFLAAHALCGCEPAEAVGAEEGAETAGKGDGEDGEAAAA